MSNKKEKHNNIKLREKRPLKKEEQKVKQLKVNAQILSSAQQLHLNLPAAQNRSSRMGSTSWHKSKMQF